MSEIIMKIERKEYLDLKNQVVALKKENEKLQKNIVTLKAEIAKTDNKKGGK